jgi:argininosuccinate synthase
VTRVVLAYSGGLDTSVAVRWLIEERGAEVVAVAADVGQGEDFAAIERRALAAGATEFRLASLREVFAEQYCVPALHANALYEGRYPLVSSLSRPCIARALVEAARETGADAVAHGCTGKGNDQVRFEVAIRSLDPSLDVWAPVREWGMTRDDCVAYAATFGIPIEAKGDNPYSIDQNLWGRACECGALEDPWNAPPEDAFALTAAPEAAPAEASEVVIGFEAGVPVSVDGAPLSVADAVRVLGEAAGAYGFGRIDMIENRRVGIKSREVYEAPGALALITAHRDLEAICLERDVMHEKARLEARWADLVYDGLWFHPLRSALDAFFLETAKAVTGEVRLRFVPGQAVATGRRSPLSLYDEGLATYTAADTFRHGDSAGYVRVYGLPSVTWGTRHPWLEPAGS